MTGVRDATNATIAAYSHDIDMYLEFLANRPDKKTDDFEINEHTMRGFAIFLRARKIPAARSNAVWMASVPFGDISIYFTVLMNQSL